MLFPKDARKTICEGLKCPNRNDDRTKGICTQRQQDKFVGVNSDNPSVLILFRDPTIRDRRPVPFVLNIKPKVNEKVTSRLFETYNRYLLPHVPDGEIIYLDNFFRCQASDADELTKNFIKNSHPFAENCYEISKLLFNILHLKCLIISSGTILIWLGQKGFLRCDNNIIMQYIKDYKWDRSNRGSFKILLNECFTLEGYDFPVFYFPYTTSMNTRHEMSYANDINFQHQCDKIRRVLLH